MPTRSCCHQPKGAVSVMMPNRPKSLNSGFPLVPNHCPRYVLRILTSTCCTLTTSVARAFSRSLINMRVSFFDPAKFCSLFGACELIVLPSKLQEAFKCVGNAITVQHGLIPLLFGIQAVFKQPLELHNLVKQSWNARLTSVNSIIFHQGDFVFIEKIEQAVIGFLSPQSPLEHQGDVRAWISIPCFFRDREFRIMATHKAPDLVARILSGPDDLLRQIYLRNEDERPNGQWTISMYAAKASEWDIMLNAKTIGSIQLSQPELCEGAPSAPCFTEVISPTVPFAVCDDSPSKPAGAHDAFDDDFDVISATRLFRIFLQVIENHNTSATTATTSVQVRSIDLATTFVAQLPDDQCDGFIAALVDHITRAGGFCTRVGNTATTKYNIVCFGVDKCNLATCSTSCLVHSGGHHGYQGIPMTLQAGADFHQRAAYAADTHGWVATDEMAFFGTLFQSLCGASVKFSPPMYWDTQMDDFDESPFGEFVADPDVKTIVPVLFRAHWGALEIERIHNRAHVTICQFPPSLHDAVLRIVARRIDIGFSCLVPHVEFDSPAPHLCGWTLVGKWIKELQILERLPDFRQQVPEPAPNLRNAIAWSLTPH